VLNLEDAPTPTHGDYDVLVRMLLAPIHPSDLHVLRGRFGRQPQLPATPGLEGMGEIEAIGSSVKGLSVGTRVVLLDVPGSWSTHVVAPAERVVPVPDNVSNEDAAQALVNPVIAIAMTIYVHKLKSGDTLLQSAASPVVGQLLLQIAKANFFCRSQRPTDSERSTLSGAQSKLKKSVRAEMKWPFEPRGALRAVAKDYLV
jgi:NADPH:quinone reductase-like Zn-dependent oxidoreductase